MQLLKELAKHRLEQAKENLEEAEILYNVKKYKGANNRAYYSIFHSIKAVLALEPIDFKRHKDVVGYFNKNYVYPEIFPRKTGSKIADASSVREDSVKATHTFLSNEEIEKIKKYVPQALEGIAHLIIEIDENENPIAFMGIEENKLEMLFIKNSERGKGLGKQLLNYGIEKYSVNELAVNEQNPQAKGFYEHMGFKVYQRNELDDQGNPYPVLYMKLEK